MSSSSWRRLKVSPALIEISRVTTQVLVLPRIGWPLSFVLSPSLLRNCTSTPATVPSRTNSCTTPAGLTRVGPVTRAKEYP